ncbi:hypothetical protein NW752_003565 [Fusarium irregulare]|uniref:DUF1275 domain protein n=1 Tax=Fusarium irregulare TaxID=2494466 RepID=A0A9W8PSQ0_9HYPO|nr:hypothetical protein NW766_004635 [Fusarium irregulare]KAJ4023104.1 hypothetical protein NW752_003565 [Fusarium irregulare]
MVLTPGTGAEGTTRDEETPLLGNAPVKRSSWTRQMQKDVTISWSDAVLLTCYVVTGLLDSSSIQVWGTFVSMQTGNTVYVGLGLASFMTSTPGPRLYKSALSIASFCIGSSLFAAFHRLFSPRRRWVLCASFTLQALLTSAAALIVTFSPPGKNTDELAWNVLVPIVLMAFQSCGQAVASRALKQNALTSLVLTSVYCDLFSDRDLFALDNVKRNQRLAAPLLLLSGVFVGGLFAQSSAGITGALWIAAGIKMCMVLAWFVWPSEEEDDETEED